MPTSYRIVVHLRDDRDLGALYSPHFLMESVALHVPMPEFHASGNRLMWLQNHKYSWSLKGKHPTFTPACKPTQLEVSSELHATHSIIMSAI